MNRRSLHERFEVPVVGLIGGVASGKSFVAQQMELLGCMRIDADKLGHDALDDPVVAASICSQFGRKVLNDQGAISRTQLAGMVFGNDPQAKQRLQKLEAILHPVIRQRVEERLEQISQMEPKPECVVLDAPLLIEAGWASLCQFIFFVDSPDEVRQQRSLARGWSQENFHAREAAQVSLEIKRRAATHFIQGDLQPKQLQLRLKELLAELRSAATH